jgi:probable F420-dependent oxidoreductase
MQFGVVFPQIEFPADPIAVRDYAQTVESLGLSFVDAYDHFLGANPDRPGGWHGPYTHESSFLEPFLLYSYMAACTEKLGFATNIIILPQRQTALVAKQAATLDVLSGGRVRLGVGLGWNQVEYAALGENFHNRGRRIEEQIEVMRALWTRPLVNFKGRWHEIQDAGIKPLPIQRPIPVWMGGTAESAVRRIARISDGWMLNFRNPDDARPAIQQLHRFLTEAGRDPAAFPIEARLVYGDGNPYAWQAQVNKWRDLGATYFSLNTMGHGFGTPAAHLEAIRKFAQAFNQPSRL